MTHLVRTLTLNPVFAFVHLRVPSMKQPMIWLLASVLAGWTLLLLLGRGLGGASVAGWRPGTSLSPDQKHHVTPRQLAASGALASHRVPPFSATSHDGRLVSSTALSAGRPMVLVFLKAGCPCNDDFEPFVQRLARAYRDEVAFAGVIDADVQAARAHAMKHRVPYPILVDPERALIARLGVENGGYVLLLGADGVLDTAWPGWSADMLREFGKRAATLAGVRERPLDTSDLPGALTTGCPYQS